MQTTLIRLATTGRACTPQWRGNLLMREERMLTSLNARIRDVRQAPDGAIWIVTDERDGRLLRITPAR